MDRWDELVSVYNEEKIENPVPVLFADSKIGKEKIKHWKKLGLRCGYIKVPVVAYEDVKTAQEMESCIYPNRRKENDNATY